MPEGTKINDRYLNVYKIMENEEDNENITENVQIKEENNKKSYILAEKLTDGYKFTYSNGYSENLTAD